MFFSFFNKCKIKSSFKRLISFHDENEVYVADMTKPHLWYPEARKMKRKFFLHVGPTNSGKTFNAIQRLAKGESAIYCAPLRLLASEIYDKLNTEYNIPCNLLTGQQNIVTPEARHVACTIEMTNLYKTYDVALIDEYQLLSDPSRGWAWSRAILGLCAKEIHLTGDPSKVKLIQDIIKIIGDDLQNF
jgi:ATP-dependent RNA helicase SUPV3L1/SUV3